VKALTRITLPFGRSRVAVEVPRANLLGIVEPRETAEVGQGAAQLGEALAQPVGSPRLCELARPGQKVVIITSDLTRPCPSATLLPPVLGELAAAGVAEHNVTIVVALGLHRAMTAAELSATVGPDVYRRLRVLNHDPADTIRLGVTSRGTPVEILRPVVEADLRVCLGNLEFHYFVGYSGGAKAILPGCASQATVTANHAMMVRPEATAGRLEGNPVRVDLEEGVALLGPTFILNVLVGDRGRVLGAVAGDVTAAHRQGCEMVAQRGKVAIPRRADIALVSAGGYPKDVNLYQAQKALDNAESAVRDGGIIILAAECPEGCGNRTFEEWMTGGDSPQALLERIQKCFVLGGHKAAAIAKVAQRVRILLVSPALAGLRLAGLEHYPTVQAALAAALEALGAEAQIIALPHGGSVLPQAPC